MPLVRTSGEETQKERYCRKSTNKPLYPGGNSIHRVADAFPEETAAHSPLKRWTEVIQGKETRVTVSAVCFPDGRICYRKAKFGKERPSQSSTEAVRISFWNGWDAIVGVIKGNHSGFVLTEALLAIAYIDFLAKGLQSGLTGWDKKAQWNPCTYENQRACKTQEIFIRKGEARGAGE